MPSRFPRFPRYPRFCRLALLAGAAFTLSSCLSMGDKAARFDGVATSQYRNFDGRRTASGELYNSELLTCGHRSLPFGTVIKVTSLATQKTVVVRVNDRGPFQKNKVLNLSAKAAEVLELKSSDPVTFEILTQT